MTIPIDRTGDMPGCFSYIVAKDSADENIMWVTETWERQTSHDASLTLSAVKNSITQAEPLAAGFERSRQNQTSRRCGPAAQMGLVRPPSRPGVWIPKWCTLETVAPEGARPSAAGTRTTFSRAAARRIEISSSRLSIFSVRDNSGTKGT